MGIPFLGVGIIQEISDRTSFPTKNLISQTPISQNTSIKIHILDHLGSVNITMENLGSNASLL